MRVGVNFSNPADKLFILLSQLLGSPEPCFISSNTCKYSVLSVRYCVSDEINDSKAYFKETCVASSAGIARVVS